MDHYLVFLKLGEVRKGNWHKNLAEKLKYHSKIALYFKSLYLTQFQVLNLSAGFIQRKNFIWQNFCNYSKQILLFIQFNFINNFFTIDMKYMQKLYTFTSLICKFLIITNNIYKQNKSVPLILFFQNTYIQYIFKLADK